jgi:amidase
LIFDVLGLYARSAEDLDLLAEVFDLHDDDESQFAGLKGAKFAICKTHVWPQAGEGTKQAMEKAATLLKAHGATVEEITLPEVFSNLSEWHRIVLSSDGHAAFLADYRTNKADIHHTLQAHAERSHGISRKAQLEAFDGIAKLRPEIDAIAGQWDAIIVPSVPDEAPEGLESTGSAAFNGMWSVSNKWTKRMRKEVKLLTWLPRLYTRRW